VVEDAEGEERGVGREGSRGREDEVEEEEERGEVRGRGGSRVAALVIGVVGLGVELVSTRFSS